jgi:hypothetical protein
MLPSPTFVSMAATQVLSAGSKRLLSSTHWSCDGL